MPGIQVQISVIIEKDEDGYYAYCPQLEGCQTQGDTLEEVQENIKEAIEFYLSTLSEEEKKLRLSQEIQSMTVEISVA
jgi:predicted RNase H-like HicB family nuclease